MIRCNYLEAVNGLSLPHQKVIVKKASDPNHRETIQPVIRPWWDLFVESDQEELPLDQALLKNAFDPDHSMLEDWSDPIIGQNLYSYFIVTSLLLSTVTPL